VRKALPSLIVTLLICAAPPAAVASNGGTSPGTGDPSFPGTGGASPEAPPPKPKPKPAPAPAPSEPSPPPAVGHVALAGFVASAPPDAPQAVQLAVAAGNRLQHKRYRYGGGHKSFHDSAYDCSGAVSYVLHGAGLLDYTLDSTGFKKWGERGPGAWISIYANKNHAFMVVGGLRLDTSGSPSGPRWRALPRSTKGFVVRHPVGL
jgi:hypothetical protein